MTGAHLSYGRLIGLLAGGVAVAALLSLLIGPAAIGFFDIVKGLFGDGSSTVVLIATEVRLPRTLMGLLVGATLGLAGAALQGYLRNPLAEPGLIGVSAGGALGAVLALYYGLSATIAWAVPIGGMVGAGVAVLLVQLLAGRGSTTLTLILAGIAVSSFAGALTSLALNLAPSPYAIVEIVFWMLGSITDRSLEHVALSAPFMVIGWVLLLSLGRALDAMALGEEAAQSLGFSPSSIRRRVIAGTALAVGAAVSVSGIIGFVGLVVPHILRPLVDHRPGRLLVASALGGALLTLAADILVRIITPSGELKLGVVTAIVGAPIFLHLVFRMRRAEGMTVLSAQGVSVVRGERPVLTGVDFRSDGGALVGLVGPNGAGKTTLLRALAGLQPVRAGAIALFGEPIGGYRPRALARRLAYMPQHATIHWDLPVRDVVMLGRSPHLGAWSAPGEEDRAIVARVMDALDLNALADRSARALSGGERARVLLGRALAGDPLVLLADEPVAGLDPYHSLEVMDHLAGLARGGALVLVVLHDLSLAMRFCDRLVLLHEGRVAHDGPPAETLDDARLAEVYRIEAQRATRDGKTAIIPWQRLDPPAG